MSNYKLVNPCIGGNMNTIYSGKSHLDAAKNTWVNLSQYLTNSVPRFAFTLEKTSDGKLHHFLVSEKADAGKKTSYSISSLDINLSSKQSNAFKNDVKDIQAKLNAEDGDEQDGGDKKKHRYRDDDSSSDSELEDAIRLMKYKVAQKAQPIYYWWYNPLVYNAVDLYIPTFTVPLSPYVHINLNNVGSTLWGGSN